MPGVADRPRSRGALSGGRRLLLEYWRQAMASGLKLASGEVGNPCRTFPPQESSSVSVFEVVLYLSALREIDSILTDVCRKICNSLQISADEKELQRRRNISRTLHHVSEEAAEHRVMQRVN